MKLKKLLFKKDGKDSPLSTLFYVFLGFILAIAANYLIGYLLNTETPVVAVFSNSMNHNLDTVCGRGSQGKAVQDYWNVCGEWYKNNGIPEEQFYNFDFIDGFEKGDMMLVSGRDDVLIGDVIVYRRNGAVFPIIHRVVDMNSEGYMTKGDNNASPDPGRTSRDEVYGRAILKIPLLGWVRIIFSSLTGH